MDHIQPRSKGGTNDESNLAAICKPCNLKKRDKTGYKNFLFALKSILFGNSGERMTKAKCEAFFNDDRNSV